MSSDERDPAGRTRFREPPGTVTKPAGNRTRFSEPRKPVARAAKPVIDPPPVETVETVETVGAADTVAAAGSGKRGRGNALAVVATILAVVLLAATVVFAVLYVHSRSNATELADTRTAVLRTAQKTAIDFSSYDYRHLNQDFAGVASQLTPAFRKSYQRTAGALKATLSQYQAVGTAKVLDAGVATLSADRATVVVFLDQTVTSKTSPTPTVDRNRIRVILERTGDRWLVSKLDVR